MMAREVRWAGSTTADAKPLPVLAVVDLADRHRLRGRLGEAAEKVAMHRLAMLVAEQASSRDVVSRDGNGRVLLLLVDRDDAWVQHRLDALCARIAESDMVVGNERIFATPVVGWARASGSRSTVVEKALTARDVAAGQLDLRASGWHHSMATSPPRPARTRRALVAVRQFALTVVLGVVLPFLALLLAGRYGPTLATGLYLVMVGVLAVTTASVWAEGLTSLRRRSVPPVPALPTPRASAIVAAYLPNESTTIVETVRTILACDYPDLEVVLAYNRPHRLPVEDVLEAIAAADPRLRLVDVADSTSKAQNVNAALAVVTGEIVGIFDADHHPEPDVFSRAWRWIAAGYDVVQGRCVVRNGEASLVACTVAVEFESIYGVSHPGRSRLHGFAVFGGSNGYWRTATLRRIRMRSSMLTEDIDASIRLVGGGGRIAHDPGLVSEELAPTNLATLWWQRLRWAQGWFQVTRAYGSDVRHRFSLSRRQRIGMMFLLRWREVTPWVGQLAVPLVGYALWQADGDWSAVSLGLPLTLLFLVSLSTTLGQLIFGWLNATATMRRRPWWFLLYLLVGPFYSEWRNVVSRVAHIRELSRTRDWVVTPRGAGPEVDGEDASPSFDVAPEPLVEDAPVRSGAHR